MMVWVVSEWGYRREIRCCPGGPVTLSLSVLQVSARTACAICVAVVAVGGACLAALLYGGGAVARHRDSEPLVSSAARRSHSAAAAVDGTAQQSASA